MESSSQEPSFRLSLETSNAAPRRGFEKRRRNRHGRGFRGELIPQDLPGSRTRSQAFDELVADSAERLSELWGPALDDVEFLIEEIPDDLESRLTSSERVPLGDYRRAAPDMPARVRIFRHPVSALVDTPIQLRELVHEIVIEQVAGLLNMDPDSVDPLFRRFFGQ